MSRQARVASGRSFFIGCRSLRELPTRRVPSPSLRWGLYAVARYAGWGWRPIAARSSRGGR